MAYAGCSHQSQGKTIRHVLLTILSQSEDIDRVVVVLRRADTFLASPEPTGRNMSQAEWVIADVLVIGTSHAVYTGRVLKQRIFESGCPRAPSDRRVTDCVSSLETRYAFTLATVAMRSSGITNKRSHRRF